MIAIVGSKGAVGSELQKLLAGKEFVCIDSDSAADFRGIEAAFFCVSSDTAKNLIPKARAEGVLCIDSSTAYRNDPSVPLVIPEINGDTLAAHQGIIASPNCTTTLMLMPLAPLHRKYRIQRIVAATYQAVSGAGAKAVEELKKQSEQVLKRDKITPKIFPVPCAFNVFLHESEKDATGQSLEEKKMHFETQKILADSSISVAATCVRVPVFRVHCQALNIEFVEKIDRDEIIASLQNTPGVAVAENPSALDASGSVPILCGRIRIDQTQENTLEMWVVGDQLLKGAALNMVQILEKCSNLPNKIGSGGFLPP